MLRIADMTELPLSWLKLGERSGEIALGSIARPWKRAPSACFRSMTVPFDKAAISRFLARKRIRVGCAPGGSSETKR
jgi:hypothetical protein